MDVTKAMKLALAGCLVAVLLASCGKKESPRPGDKAPPVIAKEDAATPPVTKEVSGEMVSPVAPATPAPEEMAPDEEDPSVPDTDQMTQPAETKPKPARH